MEIKNKYVLRSHHQGKSRVNALSFAPNNRNYASCANDTCLRYYDMQDNTQKSAIEIPAAHSDNIKQIKLLSETSLLSASSDRHVKLWDLRQTTAPVCSFKVENQIEDFCTVGDRLVIAQGNTLTMAEYSQTNIRRLNDFYPF